MAKFMYRPPPNDAAVTEMYGITFPANTPVDVPDDAGDYHDYPEKFEVDGMMRTRTVRRFIKRVDLLRHNPCFTEVIDDGGKSTIVRKAG